MVYFFWGEGCPHCGHEKPFLKGLQTKYPGMVVKEYEVWNNRENNELYRRMAAAYGIEGGNVPATFIDLRAWIGYNEDKAKEIAEAVRLCDQSSCTDPLELTEGSLAAKALSSQPRNLSEILLRSGASLPEKPVSAMRHDENDVVTLPFLGKVNASKVSLPVLTLVLAGLDGFNPCAFFVLLMLLSLMVHARSRWRMLLVGGVFVFFSGFIYFLFMAAWLNLFMITGKVAFITTAAGVVAVVMALINIKDYFFFKKGVSLTMSTKAQASLLARMRALVGAGSMSGLILGTVVLAVLANLYELLCTAGFPMVFTRALTLQKLSASQYYFYLIMYNVVYIIPLLVIVLVFVFTLGSRKLTEEEGRILKLISGSMMLGLGLVLIIRPSLLNNIFVSVALVAGVILLSVLVVWINQMRKIAHRKK